MITVEQPVPGRRKGNIEAQETGLSQQPEVGSRFSRRIGYFMDRRYREPESTQYLH